MSSIGGLQTHWKNRVVTQTDKSVRVGLFFVLAFFLSFGLWSIFIPLSSAVVASGSIVSGGQNKLLQHPTGGLVSAIHVKDGEQVKAGQTLLTLDPVVNKASLDQLKTRRFVFMAQEARLKALKKGARKISFSKELTDAAKSDGPIALEITDLLEDQKQEFSSTKKRNSYEMTVLNKQVSALNQEISSLKARMVSQQKQANSIQSELNRLYPLVGEGFVSRKQTIDLERQLDQITGNATSLAAETNNRQQRIDEINSRKSQVLADRRKTIGEEITTIRGQISELTRQMTGAARIVEQTVIKAPVDGTIVKFQAHTVGGTVTENQVIGEIVPAGAALITEARVMPQDRDTLKTGQDAEIVITAFNRRLADPIDAKVIYVSADSLLDEATGENYFVVRLENTDTASKSNKLADIRPGMQTEVYIKSEPRVFMTYLIKPISDSFRRAFREK